MIVSLSSAEIVEDANALASKPPVSMEHVFVPSWDNRPAEQPAVLSLNGTPILTHQNVSAIIASQGMGKTSVVEAICAAHLNQDIDSLGFTGNQAYRGLICCDFERTNADVWNSFYRIAKRSNLPYGSDMSKLVLTGMRSVPRATERIQAIEILLKENPCSILILDGAGDLVTDVNDLQQAIECRIWMRELTVKHDVSIFTTLHPNPGQIKPRGHLGSEIVRECESVMIITSEGGIRNITTDFEHGKNRNNGQASSFYAWDDDASMFLTVEGGYSTTVRSQFGTKKQPEPKDFSEEFHIELLKMVFSKESSLKSGQFYENIGQCWDPTLGGGDMKISRAKSFLSYYTLNDFITAKRGNTGNTTINTLTDRVIYQHMGFSRLSDGGVG